MKNSLKRLQFHLRSWVVFCWRKMNGRGSVGGREKLFLLHLFYLLFYETINRNVLWTHYGRRCSSKSLANLFRKSISLFFNSFKYIFRDSVAHWRSYFILKLKINLDTLTARLETPLRHKQRERNRTKTILDKKELRISPAVFWNSFEAVARCFGANVKLIKLILSGKIFLSLSQLLPYSTFEFLANYLCSCWRKRHKQ